jgi:type II secretory pathway component PulF
VPVTVSGYGSGSVTARPNAPTTTLAPEAVKTRPYRDRDLFFLFGQIASLFRAGVSPVQAFSQLADRAPSRYADSLREMAQRVGESKTISEVMERYPYLYPPSAVGLIRAGEMGGFLPEAAQQIADQMDSSNRLRRRLSWLLGYFMGLVFLAQIAYGVLLGSLSSIKAQDAAGGSLPIAETIVRFVKQELAMKAPIAVLSLLGIWGLIALWHTMPLRGLRHRLALGFPILGPRTRSESMARFSWTSGFLSQAGLPPRTVFELAADTLPNLSLREEMRGLARTMGETERMSQALRRSSLLPPEYASVIETGEISGDVPRAFDQIAQDAYGSFQARDRGTVSGLTFLIMAVILVGFAIVAVMLYRVYATTLIDMMLKAEG